MTAKGDHIEVGWNGKAVLSIQDSTFVHGQLGLYALGSVRIRNFQVQGGSQRQEDFSLQPWPSLWKPVGIDQPGATAIDAVSVVRLPDARLLMAMGMPASALAKAGFAGPGAVCSRMLSLPLSP